jgi:hypothetical protein
MLAQSLEPISLVHVPYWTRTFLQIRAFWPMGEQLGVHVYTDPLRSCRLGNSTATGKRGVEKWRPGNPVQVNGQCHGKLHCYR